MMRLKYQLILICSLLVFFTSPALAGVDFSVGGGYLAGDTQYQIGGRTLFADGSADNIHFPLSELSFPLDSYVVKGQIDIDFGKKWGLMLTAETNVTDDSGKMEDSDWGLNEGSPIDQLDVYSESETEMDMHAFEGKLSYQLYQGYYGETALNSETGNSNIIFSYTVGLGYKYQKYDFDVYDLDQWYPSAPNVPHDYVDGLVLTYEAEYQIPYLELGMKMSAYEKFLLDLSVAYAPYVAFKDKDQHLLRGKVNIADHGWDGDALMLNLNMRYYISGDWYLQADFEAMKITSEGQAKSYLDGVWNHTIDHEITSHQYRSYLMLGYSF
jgi:outer membrane protease